MRDALVLVLGYGAYGSAYAPGFEAREWLNLASVGATMANLNEGILGSLPLALFPSIVGQGKLMASLELQSARLSKIQQKASASVALLKERRAALITAAVTGQIDLRGAYKSRPLCLLGVVEGAGQTYAAWQDQQLTSAASEAEPL